MAISPRILSTAAAVAVTCFVSAAAYYFKSRSAEINEVMIFCKLQYNPYNCFDKLMSYIESAKRCVNICMPGIHNPAIQQRLVELITRKKILIRIAMDKNGYNLLTHNFLQELANAGVQIKYADKMKHQFCVIDDLTLMAGTLNWGDDLTMDNWNYVYVTSKQQLVEPVRMEFYNTWNRLPDIWVLSETPSESDCDSVLNNDESSSSKENTSLESKTSSSSEGNANVELGRDSETPEILLQDLFIDVTEP